MAGTVVKQEGKVATREAYGKVLVEIGRKNPNVVALDADLSDSTKSEMFQKEFPERFFNMGIAEQNLMGTAAGLAASGKIVFASTFAIFSERAFEVVRNVISRNKLNVKITGTHAGIITGSDGKSAQAIEDISIYRTLPNFYVVQPADVIEAEHAMWQLSEHNGPSYLRLLREPTAILHDAGYRFQLGKADVLRDGKDAVIFATGALVAESLNAAEMLQAEGRSVAVVNIHTIKPIDVNSVVEFARKTKHVVTAEDHNIIGGLGSAIAEVLGEHYPCKMKRVGMHDRYAESGSGEELYKKYGLSAEHVKDAVKELLKK
ncbi:transketolase family protein [Candidatus Woesearchaeota archaeon]|nr:transketolase family protein [Candidatus Woesearchaeota archaeon]